MLTGQVRKMFDLSGALDKAHERAIARVNLPNSPAMQLAYETGVKMMRECMAEEIITALIEESDPDDD